MKPMMRMTKSIATAACAVLAFALPLAAAVTWNPAPAAAAEAAQRGAATGLPLPRFVSLKSGRVNLRIGPGRDYPVSWRYVKAGIPVEIIQEYDNWRRIRDADGTEGWVMQSLLSGKRTAIAAPWNQGNAEKLVGLYSEAGASAGQVAVLEPGVLTRVESCNGDWCKVDASGASGYVRQSEIWGAYPGEIVED